VIPYVEHPVGWLGGFPIPAFWVLTVVSAMVGFEVLVRRAPRYGIRRATAAPIGAWSLAVGVVASHVVAELVDRPERIRADPWVLLWFWTSMSSIGGLVGGLLAGVAFMWRRGMGARRIRAYLELGCFAIPFAGVFARLGCALVHDHVGAPSSSFFAVAFPSGPRFDLGLLELLVHVPVATAFALLDRRPRPLGFYLGLACAIYGPARFGLDFLRIEEARYAGLTAVQYVCVLAAVAGAIILARLGRAAGSRPLTALLAFRLWQEKRATSGAGAARTKSARRGALAR
jgi:phosphatidylglycerol:prolipoprotein diacylglycerol transferase